jgi:hypothetical protein
VRARGRGLRRCGSCPSVTSVVPAAASCAVVVAAPQLRPRNPGSTIMEEGYEDSRVAASQVNAQIKRLARVLPVRNVLPLGDRHDGRTVRYMVKWANGKFWVFAGADRGGGSVTFSIPCVGNATAVVEGETRSLAINNGSFTHAFADKNGVHIYRIDGDSSRGLAK